MKESMFCGWKDVFLFTFRQASIIKKFRIVTAGVAVLLLIAGIAINFMIALSQKKSDTEISPINQVYVIDESGLEVLSFDVLLNEYQKKYPNISFVDTEKSTEEILEELGETIEKNPTDIVLQIEKESGVYTVQVIIPYGSELSIKDGELLAEDLEVVMQQSKLLSSDIPVEKLVLAMSSVSVTQLDAGESEKSIGEELVIMLVPLIFIMLLYFMNIVYGQSIGNIIVIEKSSKLMEMLLTLTKPYGIILGKILAMAVIAMIQMFVWIICFVGGFFIGSRAAAEFIYADYNNVILDVFQILQNQDGSTAFSVGAILLSLFTLCLAFLFFCVLAGMVASFASKGEQLAQTMGFYQIIIVASFFASYMLPMQGKEWINVILHIVPFTSAYLLPGDILAGVVKVPQGIFYAAVLLFFTLLLVVITGRVYKNQLFYQGTDYKTRLKGLKGKTKCRIF